MAVPFSEYSPHVGSQDALRLTAAAAVEETGEVVAKELRVRLAAPDLSMTVRRRPHGLLWGPYGCPTASYGDPMGALWVLWVLHGLLWGPHGSFGCSMSSYGCPMGLLWGPYGSFGCPMSSYGGPMGALWVL